MKELHLILRDCEYTKPNDFLIDVIVDGVKETKVQERLLDVRETLTSAKANEIGQQF